MGIKGLTTLLADVCPQVLKETKIENYFGRKIAIDASGFLYSFLIAIRPDSQFQLTDETGETTSHLQGLFNRTIRLIEHGIKPVFVFDGKPPVLKSGELARRSKRKREANEELIEAKEEGNKEDIEKLVKQTVRVTTKQNDESKRLLRLLGVPVVEAPCEAEATCAHLCKLGKVFATGSEDMDSLTLATPILLRHLTFSEAKKFPILEINHQEVLESLGFTPEQFVDFCILCGCDFFERIPGIGPKRAYELIQKHKSLEKVFASIDKTKHPIPEGIKLEEIRLLFTEPSVAQVEEDFKWTEPDKEGLIAFLVTEKQFNQQRVENAIAKLLKCRQTSSQGRLDDFFTSMGKRKAADSEQTPSKKSKSEKPKGKAKAASTKGAKGKGSAKTKKK